MSERKYFPEAPEEEHAGSAKAEASTSPNDFLPKSKKKKAEQWNISELTTFFSIAKIPGGPIMLDECTKIINVGLFIESHLQTIKVNNGNKIYLPYYERLIKLKKIIEKS
jgi:hypothetical protein